MKEAYNCAILDNTYEFARPQQSGYERSKQLPQTGLDRRKYEIHSKVHPPIFQ
jgi:hypothetical protein